MKRIKITLGLSLLLLTGLAMLVTNFVILPFWVGDILARETGHLSRLLATLPVPTDTQGQEGMPPPLQVLLEETPGGCASWRGATFPHHPGASACLLGLQPLMTTVVEGRTMRTSLSSLTSPLALLAASHLYIAVPLAAPGGAIEVVGLGIPCRHLFVRFLAKERVIVAYLVFNGLVLAALVYLRLLKAYVQPVDRLVRAAESYRSEGLHPFWVEKPTNELGQLAASIQAMVERIEHDKWVLKQTVAELGDKNRLLQQNQREMVRAEKLASVGRLAAGLAHEIGNPLGVAQGYLQLLAMEGNAEEERAEYLSKALEELARVDGLIRQLLDYARTTRGEPERFDVHGLLVDLVDTLGVQPFLDGIRLELALLAEHSDIVADREQLRQVLLNCLLNGADSIKACRGEGVISLTTELIAPDGPEPGAAMIQIAIDDNGEGIPAELLDAVFDPFFTTKEPGYGTGLGLSVSLALIEAMGGTIRLESVAGTGTTVRLLLPLAGAFKSGGEISC